MNVEELFCKLFPEYAVNGKPLSPYFDLFESGYEQSEKHITTAKEILSKLLEEEKDNMYWEMNGSDKSSYYKVRKQAEQFLKE